MQNPYKKSKRQLSTSGEAEAARKKLKSSLATSSPPESDEDSSISDIAHPQQESASALIISACDKAGMEGIDRAKIDEIILRESGNSKYMQQQRKRDQQVNERIEQLRRKLQEEERRNPKWRVALQKRVDKEMDEVLSQRPVRSACVVVDMDMFFMACELLNVDKSFADKPCCVGGGMITTSNYKARRYGVRAAMAGYIGDKLVEELSGGKEKLIHFKSNFALYKEKSSLMKQVLMEFDPNVRAFSLDEAFLDLAPYLALKITKNWDHEQIRDMLLKEQKREEASTVATPPESKTDHAWSEGLAVLASYPASSCMQLASEVVADMRQRVFDVTGGLTCSAGVAPNFLLAKIASDRNKPNGQCLVNPDHESVVDFLHPLPTRKVSGIGRVSEKTLQAFNIKTCQDLYTERALVRFLFKPATAGFLLRASVGCSSSDGKNSDGEDSGVGQKGISRERTFQSGHSWTEINSKLEDIARMLSKDMEQKDIWARTITVKVKLDTFDVFSRARSMSRGVFLQQSDNLATHAAELLREIRNESKSPKFSVRLLGIRCSNFRGDEDSSQQNLDAFFSVAQSPTVALDAACRQEGHQQSCSSTETASPKKPMSSSEKPLTKSPHQKTLLCPICQRSFDKEWLLSSHVEVCLSTSTQKKSRPFFPQPASQSTSGKTNKSNVQRQEASGNAKAASDAKVCKNKHRVRTAIGQSSDGAVAVVNCPVCQKSFPQHDNSALNRHIDSCLSGRAVRGVLQNQSDGKGGRNNASKSHGKKRRISDFW